MIPDAPSFDVAPSGSKPKLQLGARSLDVERMAKVHPGGASYIEAFAGRDATDVYLAYHAGVPHATMDTPYAELVRRVHAAGLFRANQQRWLGVVADVALFASSALALSVHPLFAAPLAVAVVRFQYTQHDIFHNQWSSNTKLNVLLGNILGLFGGASAGWWKDVDHNPHHIHTNDPDLDPNDFVNTSPWHCLGLPFVNLYIAWCSVRDGRGYERIMSLAHITLLGALLGPTSFGIFLVAYALAWVPFQLLHHPTKAIQGRGWADHQVLNTQSVGPSAALTYIMGGHNHQIEHHLFPRVPRHRLPEVAVLVKQWCAEQGLPYNQPRPLAAWRDFAVAWLHRHHRGSVA